MQTISSTGVWPYNHIQKLMFKIISKVSSCIASKGLAKYNTFWLTMTQPSMFFSQCNFDVGEYFSLDNLFHNIAGLHQSWCSKRLSPALLQYFESVFAGLCLFVRQCLVFALFWWQDCGLEAFWLHSSVKVIVFTSPAPKSVVFKVFKKEPALDRCWWWNLLVWHAIDGFELV